MLTSPDPETVFSGLAGAERIVLAVSGGSDSVALMLLAARWSHRKSVEIATVDHGLRPGSRAETEKVGQWAAQLGFAHTILTWRGDKPKTCIQERARTARYALLLDHAQSQAAGGIVTAHHADDQAETILFRLTKGSSVAGLAGMRGVVERGGLHHWRPLLAFPKAVLVEICQAAQHPWIEDPSNLNPAFARVRLRAVSEWLAQEGLDRAGLLRLGRRAEQAENALEFYLAHARTAWRATRADMEFTSDGQYLTLVPKEMAQRLLELEVQAVTHCPEPMRLERLERAASKILLALAEGKSCTTSLGGAVITLNHHAQLQIVPEPPRRRGRSALQRS